MSSFFICQYCWIPPALYKKTQISPTWDAVLKVGYDLLRGNSLKIWNLSGLKNSSGLVSSDLALKMINDNKPHIAHRYGSAVPSDSYVDHADAPPKRDSASWE